MSTWKNVGMTYLKFADLCATHVRNCLKEPAKSKAANMSNMHARVTLWENGKRGKPGAQRRPCIAKRSQSHPLCISHAGVAPTIAVHPDRLLVPPTMAQG